MKIIKENIFGIITTIVLVIICSIILGSEYFVFIQPMQAKVVFVTPSAVDTSKTTDETLIGTYFDDFAPSKKFTTILRKTNGLYFKTEIFSNGTWQVKKLNVNFINGEERLVEEGDDGYSGKYLVVEKDGSIAFYDKNEFIYRLHPKQP